MTFADYKREQEETLTKQGFTRDGTTWKGSHFWALATNEMAPIAGVGRPCLVIKYFKPS